MSTRKQPRKSKASSQCEISKPPPTNVVQFPVEAELDRDTTARWINLADQVLGNKNDTRKKA